jgi:hypothetical protein
MSAKPLPGFRDFYPAEFAERAHIMRVWREIARRYAFVEYDGPPLEPLDLYTRKSGEEIVGQLYNFVDKGERPVSLRPEMTPTFARMVAARANALRKPVRWFSVPQLFRYERQQRGRLREHFQLNVDIVGEADVTADAELLAVAIDMLRALGLTQQDVRARVSDRRLLTALLTRIGVAEAQLPSAYAAIDKVERDPRELLVERMAPRARRADRRARARLRAPRRPSISCAPTMARTPRSPRSWIAWRATWRTSTRSASRLGGARPDHRARARVLHRHRLRAVRRPRRVPRDLRRRTLRHAARRARRRRAAGAGLRHGRRRARRAAARRAG